MFRRAVHIMSSKFELGQTATVDCLLQTLLAPRRWSQVWTRSDMRLSQIIGLEQGYRNVIIREP